MTFAVVFSGRLPTVHPLKLDAAQEEAKRPQFIASLNASLRMETPDPVLNRAFAFAKWRIAESINQTRGGPLLAPGNQPLTIRSCRLWLPRSSKFVSSSCAQALQT